MRSSLFSKTAFSSLFSGVFLLIWHAFCAILIAVFLSYGLSFSHWFLVLYPVAVLWIGTRMRALGNVIHECCHHSFVPKAKHNERIGSFLCQMEFSSFAAYKRNHMAHHRFLGSAKQDPDFSYYLYGLKKSSKKQGFIVATGNDQRSYSRIFYATIHPGNWISLWWRSLHWDKKNKGCWLMLCAWGCLALALGPWFFLGFVIVPYLTSYQALKIFSDMMDHDGVYFSQNRQERSCNHVFSHFILNWIFFPRNDEYHLVHHLYPRIPSNQLGKKHHELLKTEKWYAQKNHKLFS